jgi:quercetin dioxygenase-like cupin family protein
MIKLLATLGGVLCGLLTCHQAYAQETCQLPGSGTFRQNPPGTVRVRPLLARTEVDSLGMYGGWINILPGASVAEHVHAEGDEILWATCGSGTLLVDGREISLREGGSLRIPRGVKHAATAGERGMVAVQVYRPGAPGLRFYDWAEHPKP